MQNCAQKHIQKTSYLSSVFLYHYQQRTGTERNGTERNGTRLNGTEWTGTESQTTQICWNINDQVFNQSVFVCTIFNDKHEAIACRLLPRDRVQKASYFGCLANPQMSSVFLYHYYERTGTERNKKTDRHLWKKSDVHVQRSIIPFCRRPTRQRLNSSEFSTVMEQF